MNEILLTQILKTVQSIEDIATDVLSATTGAMNCFNSTYKNLRETRRKRNIKGTHTREEWESLKAFYNYTCLCCYRQEPEIRLTKDHVMPVSKNGSNRIGNIQPLCEECNSTKGDQYMDYRGIYRAILSIKLQAAQIPPSYFLGTLPEFHQRQQAEQQ